MKILHAGTEVFPLVKTGGLADVLGALPQALVKLGADVRLVLPGLPEILQGLEQARTVCQFGPAFGAIRVTLRRGVLAHSGVTAYVVDAPYLYRRAGSPYMDTHGFEWTDNLQRFALLGWVSAHLASAELDPDWIPDVLHAHDWHAAMACAYIAAHPGTTASTVFTVHNLAYQGLFNALDYHVLGLPARFMVPGALEFHGQFSFMKAGLTYSDRVTTVSPTFAAEMATQEFGFGLDGVIRERGTQVSGILNGVDDAVWNPQSDALIAAPYSSAALAGKARCKAQLQQTLGLDAAPRAPLLALVSRLTQQKGLDLVLAALPALVAQGVQLAVQGTGNAALELAFVAAQERFGGKVAARIAYDEPMAHQIVAGADMMLVPSRFEPCGLTQLYGLRYGTVPVVRRVGGLADTVTDASVAALASGKATGFAFGQANVEDLVAAVTRAVGMYADQASWRALMRAGMGQEFSWDVAANKYMDLYRELLAPEPQD